MKVTAEVDADHQHGPVVTVCVDGVRVSVYLADETGLVTTDSGTVGVQVTGPWHAVRDQLAVIAETRRAPTLDDENDLDDGFGNVWTKCDDPHCDLEIVRPGKVQCERCQYVNEAASREVPDA